ncbi:MAG: alkyl sulfatase dimerization domain-containing protein [Pseudomonadales bacterium]
MALKLSSNIRGKLLFAIIGIAIGLSLSQTDITSGVKTSVSDAASSVRKAGLEKIVDSVDSLGTRELLFLEHPEMIPAIAEGGGFGGDFSKAIGQDIFGNSPEAQADAEEMSRIVEVAPRTWMIYLPIVNIAVLETDDGLVLIDTGMRVAGPVIKKLIATVSSKPIHTIIYTHGHVDHSYGTWALTEDNPQIIAQADLPKRFDRYLRLRGSLANYMSQPVASLPKTRDDLVYPTETFRNELTLTIGGEEFILRAHRGETDDQLYVWIPGRKQLAAADYYQGFLPNAGNGKRMQRYPEDWAAALREMAAEDVQLILPAHGEAISDPVVIHENLTVLAETLQYIVDHTIAELNKGVRKDLVYQSLQMPERLLNHPSLSVKYVSHQDISKMVIKNYTGWWDDIPSNWTPVLFDDLSAEIVQLAGGIEAIDTRARTLIPSDIKMASHLADWAWYANPDDSIAQQLVIDVYRNRILDKDTNTMEMLNYVKVMTEARQAQLDAAK